MKRISEKQALERLAAIQRDFSREVSERYEHKARPCSACPTFGACCVDAHFVNVRITRLEARSIQIALDGLPAPRRARAMDRVDNAAAEIAASGPDADVKFSCPLFEKSAGCLVHGSGKPAACVVHACYDDPADLPPDGVLDEQLSRIDRLSTRVYGSGSTWLPLPSALKALK